MYLFCLEKGFSFGCWKSTNNCCASKVKSWNKWVLRNWLSLNQKYRAGQKLIQLKHDHKRALRWRLWKVRVAVASYFPGPISRFIDPSIPIENDSFAHALSNRLSKLLLLHRRSWSWTSVVHIQSGFLQPNQNGDKLPLPVWLSEVAFPTSATLGWLAWLPSFLPANNKIKRQ